MSDHRIHMFRFERWEGEKPPFAAEVVSTHNVPGQDGAGYQLLGKQGDEFTAELVAYVGGGTNYANMLYATWIRALMTYLPELAPVAVIYNGVPLLWYRHKFKVIRVRPLEIKAIPRALGDGFDYNPAVRLRVAITMVPHRF